MSRRIGDVIRSIETRSRHDAETAWADYDRQYAQWQRYGRGRWGYSAPEPPRMPRPSKAQLPERRIVRDIPATRSLDRIREERNRGLNPRPSQTHQPATVKQTTPPKAPIIALKAVEQELVARAEEELRQIRIYGEQVISSLRIEPPANAESRLWIFKLVPDSVGFPEAFRKSGWASRSPVEEQMLKDASPILSKYTVNMPSIKRHRIELAQR
jgi:hypothetical protein